jgi:predicted nucleotidyltransferase
MARVFRSTLQQGRSAKQLRHHTRPTLANIVKLEGVTAAYIFGSWAARYSGEQGVDPGDVDLLLVGQFDRSKAFKIALQASRQVGKEINVNNLSADEWEAGELGFVKTLKSRPLIQIIGSTPSD